MKLKERITKLEHEQQENRILLAALLRLFPTDKEQAILKVREFEQLLSRLKQ